MVTQELELQLQNLTPEIRRFLRGRLPACDVEDVLQDVLLRALTAKGSLRDQSQLRAWLYSVARHRAVDYLRRQGREIIDSEIEVVSLNEEASPCACGTTLASKLAPGQAQMVRLVDLESRPLAEAAQLAGTSVNAATVTLHRARQNLRKRLTELCGAHDYKSASACDCGTTSCAG